jgi:glutamyl-tRNA reductase
MSISFAAVQLAGKALGDLSEARVLVVSAGQAGKLAGKALREWGVKELAVTNRTYEKAMELAQELEGRALPFGHLEQELSSFDIVVSATGSPRPILTKEILAKAMQRRNGLPVCIIDIAVPRDVEPSVGQLPNVFLYDIDDLQQVTEAHRKEREKEVAAVEVLVEREMARFMRWWQALDAVPVIASLRQKAEGIRQRELDKTLKKMRPLTAGERERLETLTKAIVNKVLHDPIVTLKAQGKDRGYIQTVSELFHLDPQERSPHDQ